jgi:DNA-binding transcriptional ArsR family regulator
MLTHDTLDEHLAALPSEGITDAERVALREKIDSLADRARNLVEQYTPGVTDDIDTDPNAAIGDLMADLLLLGATLDIEPDTLLEHARRHAEATLTPDDVTLGMLPA